MKGKVGSYQVGVEEGVKFRSPHRPVESVVFSKETAHMYNV